MVAITYDFRGMKTVLGVESPEVLEVDSCDRVLGGYSYLIHYHLGEVKPGWSVRSGCVN